MLDVEKIAPKAKFEFKLALQNSLSLLDSKFEINNKLRWAHFLAQCAHESMDFTVFIENLNYSAERLVLVFPKYFPNFSIAKEYDRKPEKIANIIYANRMGNGNTASGDGWKYRGRGLIQLTGKYNYHRLNLSIDNDVINNPDYVASNEGAILSAAWFWHTNNLNSLADKDDCELITRKINGGLMGLQDRIAKLQKYKSII